MTRLMTKHSKPSPRRYDLHRSIPATPGLPATTPGKPVKLDAETIKAPPKKRWFTWKKAILTLFLLLLTPLLIIGIWDYRNFASASNKLFGSSSIVELVATQPLDETTGRVNILLVGYSVDDPEHAGAQLTDSIMILSLSRQHKNGFMLSVPRDLYVTIPDYGRAKINEAFQAGERNGFRETGYPDGGIGLLEKVVSEQFAIELHYYAILNYGAVREIVDALEGVRVTIDSPDPRGVYDPNFRPHEGGPLRLENGTHLIDGQTALRLTRARGATYGSFGFPLSDFNRTKNQQQVLTAIKSELDWKLVLDPRTNGQIFRAVANNLKTDLQLAEVLPLYRLLGEIPESNLKPVSLNDMHGINLLRGYTTPSGQSALIPAAGINNFTQIQDIIDTLQH